MGVFWAGIRRGCIRGPLETLASLFGDVRSLSVQAETSVVRLRRAVGGLDLQHDGAGLGAWVDKASSYPCAVSVSLAVFGVRHASELAALAKADVVTDESAAVVELKIPCGENDQLGVWQMAHIAALPAWKASARFVFWRIGCCSQIGCRAIATDMVAPLRLPSARRCLLA